MLFIDDPYHNRYYTTLRTLKVHNKKRRKIFTRSRSSLCSSY